VLPFKVLRNSETGEESIETWLTGQLLLDYPLLNKGSAFNEDERREFAMLGVLPPHVSTMEEQLERIYGNYRAKESDLERYIFLVSLQDRNETLFYRLLGEHITEMMPIIYTPVVGAACQAYSHIYRRPRGLYVSFAHRHEIDAVLDNAPNPNVEVIVATDGERILGLGDLGVGGMGIPVGKLSLYTLCAGINPTTTLPILLDVGTRNQDLLDDPLYLGWRHKRIEGADYDDFIEEFVAAVERRFPGVLFQWEDFSKKNAARLLDKYRDRLCTFNDDIQGTGAVTLAALLAAVQVTGSRISQQRVVLLGAGSAATGITRQIVTAMMSGGLSLEQARSAIWLVDSHGLVHTGRSGLEPLKQEHAQPLGRTADWRGAGSGDGEFTLGDVVRHARPTILIGTAAQPGAFTEEIIREMAAHVERPIIFPLSNPTSKSEALPVDLISWTYGRALVSTGSPFTNVIYNGRSISIGQCNNAYIFPGVGLGVIASKARRVTDSMFVAAARALSRLSPVHTDPTASLLPPLADVREVSREVAVAVAAEAQRAGVAEQTRPEEIGRRVDAKMWTPRYLPYTLVACPGASQ
jgi:malate dehydrogenase (oxaloacetate-decarboxylating)